MLNLGKYENYFIAAGIVLVVLYITLRVEYIRNLIGLPEPTK